MLVPILSILAENLVNEPNPLNKYGVLSVAHYYSHLGLRKTIYIIIILRDIHPTKPAYIERFLLNFLRMVPMFLLNQLQIIGVFAISLNIFPGYFLISQV